MFALVKQEACKCIMSWDAILKKLCRFSLLSLNNIPKHNILRHLPRDFFRFLFDVLHYIKHIDTEFHSCFRQCVCFLYDGDMTALACAVTFCRVSAARVSDASSVLLHKFPLQINHINISYQSVLAVSMSSGVILDRKRRSGTWSAVNHQCSQELVIITNF